MKNPKVELGDSERPMAHPIAVETPAGEEVYNAAEVSIEPEIDGGSLETVRDQEPADEMSSEKEEEAAGPATPLKQDNISGPATPLKQDDISKEAITEKSPEVGIKGSPSQAEEATAPATPLKQDNISKEAITEKSPEVGIRAGSPTQLVEASLHKHEVKQRESSDKTNLEKEIDFASYQKELKSILEKMHASKHDSEAVSQSLRSVYERFSEMKVDLDDVVSNLASLTHSLVYVKAKERDELRSLIEKLTAAQMAQIPSVPSVDMLRLRVSVERVQSLVEQVSALLSSCFAKSFHDFLQPIWRSSEEDSRNLYICSVVSHRMFLGFENEDFMVNQGASPILDLETLRNDSKKKYLEFCNKSAKDLKIFDHLFDEFASEKKVAVLKEVKKVVLVGTVDLGVALMRGDIVGRQLDDLAKEVWAMHKLSLSMECRARILRVKKGDRFEERWMEAVNSPTPDKEQAVGAGGYVKFMIMPGFQVLDTLVSPCRVYL